MLENRNKPEVFMTFYGEKKNTHIKLMTHCFFFTNY